MIGATGTVPGGTGFTDPPDAKGVVAVGYGIVPEHQGRGLANEVLQALLAAAAKDPEIDLVFAQTEIQNRALRRLAEKAGMHLARAEGGCHPDEWRKPIPEENAADSPTEAR